MPNVDILSFTCRDEQEFGQDEVYVRVRDVQAGHSDSTPIYRNLDTGDTIRPNFDPFNFASAASIRLWEDDGASGDDWIGSVSVDRSDIGTHTVTLQGSGGEYDLTYRVW